MVFEIEVSCETSDLFVEKQSVISSDCCGFVVDFTTV